LLTKAQQQHPADFWINFNLVSFLKRLDPVPIDDVIRYASVARALRPQTPAAYNSLGNALTSKGLFDKAIAEFRTSIRIQDNAISRFNLGFALFKRRRLDDAIIEYQKAILLKNDYAAAHNWLGHALHDKGRPDEAIEEYKEALRIKECAGPHLGL